MGYQQGHKAAASLHLSSSAVYALLSTAALALGPVQVQWSDKSYGPDGPWHAVRAEIGNPPQQMDLFPIVSNYSWPLGQKGCERAGACLGGFYSPSLSSSADTNLGSHDNSGEPVGGAAVTADEFRPVIDDLILKTGVQNGTLRVPNTALDVIEDGRAKNYRKPHLLPAGYLGLGSAHAGPKVGGFGYNYPQRYLHENGNISSLSFGLHYGSPSLNIPPSLYLGGYDRSRVLGPVLSQPVPALSQLADVLVQSISLHVDHGTLPFSHIVKNYLGSNPISSPVIARISTTNPGFNLPLATCENFRKPMPLMYDGRLRVYTWDTTDKRYDEIMRSPSYLQLEISSIASNFKTIPIKIPLQLLSLTLERPLVKKPTLYFPCFPMSSDGERDAQTLSLGLAFFQAAFIGYNWNPHGGESRMFIAQAPGPRIALPDPVNITHDATTITSSNAIWRDSWAHYWASLPEKPPSSLPSLSSLASPSLLTGAKVGIGIGAAVGAVALLLLVYLYIRRRKRRAAAAKTKALQSKAAIFPDSDFSTGCVSPSSPKEMLVDEPTKELPNKRHLSHELSDAGQRPAELDTERDAQMAELDAGTPELEAGTKRQARGAENSAASPLD